jgi:hypothetical protein
VTSSSGTLVTTHKTSQHPNSEAYNQHTHAMKTLNVSKEETVPRSFISF